MNRGEFYDEMTRAERSARCLGIAAFIFDQAMERGIMTTVGGMDSLEQHIRTNNIGLVRDFILLAYMDLSNEEEGQFNILHGILNAMTMQEIEFYSNGECRFHDSFHSIISAFVVLGYSRKEAAHVFDVLLGVV